jgi:hypothetical protein
LISEILSFLFSMRINVTYSDYPDFWLSGYGLHHVDRINGTLLY